MGLATSGRGRLDRAHRNVSDADRPEAAAVVRASQIPLYTLNPTRRGQRGRPTTCVTYATAEQGDLQRRSRFHLPTLRRNDKFLVFGGITTDAQPACRRVLRRQPPPRQATTLTTPNGAQVLRRRALQPFRTTNQGIRRPTYSFPMRHPAERIVRRRFPEVAVAANYTVTSAIRRPFDHVADRRRETAPLVDQPGAARNCAVPRLPRATGLDMRVGARPSSSSQAKIRKAFADVFNVLNAGHGAERSTRPTRPAGTGTCGCRPATIMQVQPLRPVRRSQMNF